MRLRLLRWHSDQYVTCGTILGPAGVLCSSLELPWRDNARSVSCIPVGVYSVVAVRSARFGFTYSVSVPERSGILFHAGNAPDDSRGCILPVSEILDWRGVGSRKALDRLLRYLHGTPELTLEVVNATVS